MKDYHDYENNRISAAKKKYNQIRSHKVSAYMSLFYDVSNVITLLFIEQLKRYSAKIKVS